MKLSVREGYHVKTKHIKEVQRLMNERGGLSAHVVLDEARKKRSPLHDHFEWDNDIAAEKFRLEQAKYLLRAVVVEVEVDNKPTFIRAFHAVKDNEDDEFKTYYPLKTILSDEDKRQQVIEYALSEMEGWRTRYHQYSQLQPIITSYEKVKRRLKKKTKK